MSAVDPGLDAAVQRVMRELGCSNRRGVCTLHGIALWLDGLGCERAVEVARAAREDVPAPLPSPNKWIADLVKARQEAEAALADAWDAGLRAGEAHQRSLWQWSAGSISRAVNGLTSRPVRPDNPHRHD